MMPIGVMSMTTSTVTPPPTDINFTLMYRGQHNWPGIYAHCDAEGILDRECNKEGEEFTAPDLISCNYPMDVIPDGTWPCTVYIDHEATLFKWKCDEGRPRGLVCLNTDKNALHYARQCLKERRNWL